MQPHRALSRRRGRCATRRARERVPARARRGRAAGARPVCSTGSATTVAALHLFRVAAGLDSLVPGEGEILGQVRDAFEAGAAGPLLDRLFRQALHAGRRARVETAIGESPASVPAAAAALAQQVFGELDGPRPCFCRRRQDERADRAQPALARRRDRGRREPHRSPTARSWRGWSTRGRSGWTRSRRCSATPTSSSRSTSAPGFVLDVDRGGGVGTRAAAAGRCCSSTLPCRVTSTRRSPRIDGCFVYDIDDLEAVVEASLAGRRAEAVRAERLVAGRGRALPRVAGVAGGRARDRVAAGARRGDPRRRAGEGRGPARAAAGERPASSSRRSPPRS